MNYQYIKPVISFLIALMCFIALNTFTIASTSYKDIHKNLDELMALYAEEGHHNRIESPFNGAVLVAKHDDVLMKKAYGFADIENQTELATDSKFLIGSVTKQFTAMLVLILVERGKLDLGGRINQYLPDYSGPSENATIHQLLSHSSGLPHYEGLRRLGISFSEFWQRSLSSAEYAQIISQMALVNEPGTEFNYSSMNYVLLGAILEHVTGQTYAQLLAELITTPLKLHNTGYFNNEERQKHIVKGHTFKEGGFFEDLFFNVKGEFEVSSFRDQTTAFSTGGMHSTLDDLYLWVKAIKSHTLLSEDMTSKMLSPNIGGYGYGWFINQETMIRYNPSVQLVSHGGRLGGFASNIALYEDGTTVIYLSNLTPVGDFRLTMNLHLTANGIDIDDFTRDIRLPDINHGLDDFLAEGGIDALRKYYDEISRRAGYKVEISQWGYQELIQMYLEAEQWSEAESLYREFLTVYSTPNKYWLNRLGYDFSEHNKHSLAIDAQRRHVDYYPYSASAFDSLGDAYFADGQTTNAHGAYQQAVEIARMNQDKHLAYYQQQIAKVADAKK